MASAQRAATPKVGGTTVIGGGSDLQLMNSLVSSDMWTNEFINNALFVPLVRLNPDLSYAPALAESWRLIGDTAVVFRIRKDVRWHDGLKTSAHDVAFTFNRLKDEKTGFPNAEWFEYWESVQVIDSFTVRFRLKKQVEPLFGWISTAIMPKHLLDTIPPERMRQAAFNKAPVGNGPFRFVSMKANDRWVFEANQAFPRGLGGRPYLDRIVWRVIPDNSAQLTEIQTGGIDIATAIRAEQTRQMATQPGYRMIMRPTLRYVMITWNGKKAPLKDARVRRALTMAMNREQMIKVLRSGFAQVMTTPIPPSHWAFDKTLAPLPYDPIAAKKLLAEAGYPNGFEVELKIPANNAFNRDLAEMARADLEKIGVKLNARAIDYAAMIKDISTPERNYEGAALTFSTDYKLSLADAFHSKNINEQFNPASFGNPRLDQLLDRAAVTTNRAEAQKIWKEAQKILRDEQPWSFMWWAPDLFTVRDRLQGVTMDIRGQLRSLPQWYVSTR